MSTWKKLSSDSGDEACPFLARWLELGIDVLDPVQVVHSMIWISRSSVRHNSPDRSSSRQTHFVRASNVNRGLSLKPVFDAQAGHLFEVPQIRAEQGCCL